MRKDILLNAPPPLNIKTEVETPETISYPIPCSFCNMLAQDANLDPNNLKRKGFLVIKNGEVTQVKHLPNCPEVLIVRYPEK